MQKKLSRILKKKSHIPELLAFTIFLQCEVNCVMNEEIGVKGMCVV